MKKSWIMGLVGLKISFLITLVLIRYYLMPGRETERVTRQKPVLPDKEIDEQIVIEEAVSTEPDDLTVVEGIGPKSATALQGAGVTTYAQLADMDTDTIKAILSEANVRVAVSDTWAVQAGLAAAEDWKGLEELKAVLNAGRRQ